MLPAHQGTKHCLLQVVLSHVAVQEMLRYLARRRAGRVKQDGSANQSVTLSEICDAHSARQTLRVAIIAALTFPSVSPELPCQAQPPLTASPETVSTIKAAGILRPAEPVKARDASPDTCACNASP